MNIKFSIPILLFAAATTSCNNNGNATSETAQTDNTPATHKSTRNVIRRTIPLSDTFEHIFSRGSIDIIYIQGPDCHFEVEGDSSTLEHLYYDLESKILTLGINSESNTDINAYTAKFDVKAYLTSPSMRYVSLAGSGSFTCDTTWTSTDVQLGAMGTGNFHISSLKCQTFLYNSTGSDTSEINNVEADEITLLGSAQSHLTISVNTNSLLADANNQSQFDISGTANHKNINRSGNGIINDNLKQK